MLSIEEVKKGCEFAEGFEWVDPYHNNAVTMNDPAILDPYEILWVSVEGFSKDVVIYPLFLQRVCDKLKIVAFNDKDKEDYIKDILTLATMANGNNSLDQKVLK